MQQQAEQASRKQDRAQHELLLRSAEVGDGDVVMDLLVSGTLNVNIRNRDGATPLFLACWHGHEEVVDMLLEYGAGPDKATKVGFGITGQVHVSCQCLCKGFNKPHATEQIQ